jgi:hypothetical protein
MRESIRALRAELLPLQRDMCSGGPTEALRVLVSGSRDWPFEWSHLVHEKLDKLPKRTIIVHGACPSGVDAFAEDWVQVNRGGDADRFPANWRRNGIGAGHIRNLEMLNHLRKDGHSLVMCFFWTISPGTLGMAQLAYKAGVPLICYQYDTDVQEERVFLSVIDNSSLMSLRP